MDNNQDYCSYELSKALKACGFDEPCDHYYAYDEESKIKHLLISASPSEWDWNYAELPEFVHPECSAPLLFHAQKWLREKWDWHIDVSPAADCSLDADGQVCEEWNYWAFDIMHVISTRRIVESMEQYGSYEEALSAGISAAQELIKKGE